jgi:two-component system chemotaxis sensor kinase CheA
MDDLLSEFLTETAESLETVDTELVRFEADPTDRNTLNNIFRLVHTIKGTCGFLGLPRLEAVAHAGETLLGRFRDGTLAVTPDAVTLVLSSIDRIKEILAHLESAQVEPEGDDRDLIDRLEAAAEGRLSMAAPAPVKVPEPVPEPIKAPVIVAAPVVEPAPVATAEAQEELGRWDADLGRHLRPGEVSLAELEAAFLNTEQEVAEIAPLPTAPVAALPGPSVAASLPSLQAAAAISKTETRGKPEFTAGDSDDEDGARIGKGESSLANQTIRVSVDVLESLMTMVSELVLTRNQLLQMVRGLEDSQFKVPLQRLSSITGELQEGVMKTRMQPIGSAWKKLPRIVRDANRDLGKKIDLVLEGEATELDRQVLELIKDPLTHMIRNSCDHGVESPDVRVSAGKPEKGTIKLAAYHEGGHIIIEVADDGAGLKPSRIREKALEKGVITPAEAESMSEASLQRLIFAPGFSTAAKVTNMSGRGVGMDVVKTNIEMIGGTIDLKSREGEGTTFKIKIPLTLAIISSLVIGAGGSRFALPQLAVVELVRTGHNCEHKIEMINSARLLRLRDRLLPLVSLADTLNLPSSENSRENAFVVVMQVGEQRFGMLVDEVYDTEEIVVKPLTPMLRGIDSYSGATILGDGSVILILDPNGMAKVAAQTSGSARMVERPEAANDDRAEGGEAMGLLLFNSGNGSPRACPLSLVTRLEELDAGSFERTQKGIVVQYRGQLMPIVHADGPYGIRSEGRQPVLVFYQGDKAVGLAVDKILDIVHDRLVFQHGDETPGLLGSVVLKGRATEIIDVGYYLSLGLGNWTELATGRKAQRRRVLLVETHPFFRNMLAPLIEAAGYDVTAVDGAKAVAALAEAGRRFDIVMADADDAGLNAELSRVIEASPALSGIARLALSNRTELPYDLVEPVVRKADRQGLLAVLDTLARKKDAA